MHLTMIGTGYVGLVTSACLAEFGHSVCCVDIDPERIAKLKEGTIPFFEPGLNELVKRNVAAGRLNFTLDTSHGVAGADAVFIAVGTPARPTDGHADLTYVYTAARQIAENVTGRCMIINKSTVPVGTARAVGKIVADVGSKHEIVIASNPEFLREGSAIHDFEHPNRIVCGVTTDHARNVMKNIYSPLFRRYPPLFFTNWESSELIKYAANGFLAMKVAFINEMADLCEETGADVTDLSIGMGMDDRIGKKFLNPGPGYGGSCFPKDTLALLRTSEAHGRPITLIAATVEANERRKKKMAEKVVMTCGGDIDGKKIAVLGLTFKPNTDDMRDAPSLQILPYLQERGAHIHAFDPEGGERAKMMLPGITLCPDIISAVSDADAVVLITHWNEFRSLELGLVRTLMKTPIFVDLRNVYSPEEMREAGFRYISIGRAMFDPMDTLGRSD